MDYKKKYNNALDRARLAIKDCGDNQGRKKIIYGIFPDLAESDDERIRSRIVTVIKNQKEGYLGLECNHGATWDEMLAYLEKQKEQKPEHFELKAGKWYICHRAYCCRADHLTVKEGERFMCEEDGVVKGFVVKKPEKYFIECSAPVPMEDEQKEQKPAEWSENDDACCKLILKELEHNKESQPDYSMHFSRLIEWFITRFKSLRPQPHWKPSEEQMEALRSVSYLSFPNEYEINSLYNELKKL